MAEATADAMADYVLTLKENQPTFAPRGAEGKRKHAAWNHDYLLKVL